jgi:hypothetical protein
MTDYNDGKWHAHKENKRPLGLNDNTEVEVYWVDYSEFYLPEGFGEVRPWKSKVIDTKWDNLPCNKQIVAFRVTKQHKEPMTAYCAIRDGDVIDVSANKHELYPYGYDDIRKFVEVT